MSQTPSTEGPRGDSIERVYVLWIATTLGLLLLISILALLGGGRLRRQAQVIDSLNERVAAVESELARRPASRAIPTPANSEAAPARDEPQSEPPPREEPAPPSASAAPTGAVPHFETPPVDASQEPTSIALGEPELRRVLPMLVRVDLEHGFALGDAEAAAELVQALRNGTAVAESGATCAEVAVLAELCGESDLAAAFARRAAQLGDVPVAFLEVAARRRLAAGRPAAARPAADDWVDAAPGSSAARVCAAAAWIDGPGADRGAAAARIASGVDVAALSEFDQARLGRLAARLELWALMGVVAGVAAGWSPGLADERDFVRAVQRVQSRDYPAAVAIFDSLAARRPDDYDAATWRGVALLEAGSLAEAAAALDHAQQTPQRPEAWYWRGVLAARRAEAAEAARLYEAALAADPRYAPAHEGLATLAMNDRDLARAAEHLALALQSEPGRGQTHFLLAVVYARGGQRSEAVAALRAAVAIDPAWLATARETEALVRLIGEEELKGLAAGPVEGELR